MTWRVEIGFLVFGAIEASATNDFSTTPIVDRDGRMAGCVSWIDRSDMFTFTEALTPSSRMTGAEWRLDRIGGQSCHP